MSVQAFHRNLLAAATTGLLALPAGFVSAAEIDIYGAAHLSTDILNDGDDTGLNVSSNESHLGFRAGRQVGDDLRLMLQIEQEILFDTEGLDFATRDTFLGAGTGFGLLRVGKMDTPMKELGRSVDLFPNQVGDARNLTGNGRTIIVGPPGPPVMVTAGFDRRFPNSIHYRTPDALGPFAVNVHYATTLDGSDTVENGDDGAFSLSAVYSDGPVMAGFAYEWLGDDVGDRNALRIAGSFDLDALRFTALLQSATDPDDMVLGGGVRYRMGDTDLKAQLYALSGDEDDTDAQMLAIGADHHYAGDLTLYAVFGAVSNDDNTNLTPYMAGRSANPDGQFGENTLGLSVGLVYTF